MSRERIHEAVQDSLDEGELAICWTLTIDVASSDGTRYLAHRAGGGSDGNDSPMAWTALGMLEASVGVAEEQVLAMTRPHPEDEADGE